MREWKDKRERIFSVFALYSEKQTKISKKMAEMAEIQTAHL